MRTYFTQQHLIFNEIILLKGEGTSGCCSGRYCAYCC